MSDLEKIASPSRNTSRGNAVKRPNTLPGIGSVQDHCPVQPPAVPVPPAAVPVPPAAVPVPPPVVRQTELPPVSVTSSVSETEENIPVQEELPAVQKPEMDDKTVFPGRNTEEISAVPLLKTPIKKGTEDEFSDTGSRKTHFPARSWFRNILYLLVLIYMIILVVQLFNSGKKKEKERIQQEKATAEKSVQEKKNTLSEKTPDRINASGNKQAPVKNKETVSRKERTTENRQKVSSVKKTGVSQKTASAAKTSKPEEKPSSSKAPSENVSVVKVLSAAEAQRAYFWISNQLSLLQKPGDSVVIDCLYPGEKIVSVVFNGNEEVKVIRNKIIRNKIGFSGTETKEYSFSVSYTGKSARIRFDSVLSDVPSWTSLKLSSGETIYCSWNKNCQVPPAKEIGVCLRDKKFLIVYNLDGYDSTIIGKDKDFYKQIRVRFFEKGKRKAYSYLTFQGSSLVGNLELRFPEYRKILDKSRIYNVLDESIKDSQLQSRARDIYRYLNNLSRNIRELQDKILTSSDAAARKAAKEKLEYAEYARQNLLSMTNIFFILGRNGFKITYSRGGRTYTRRRAHFTNPFIGKNLRSIALVMRAIGGKYAPVSEMIEEYAKDFPEESHYLTAPAAAELRRAQEDIRKRLGRMEAVLVKHKKIFRSIERVNSL